MYNTLYYASTFGMTAKLIGLILFDDNFYKFKYYNLPVPSTALATFATIVGTFIGICTDVQILYSLTLI